MVRAVRCSIGQLKDQVTASNIEETKSDLIALKPGVFMINVAGDEKTGHTRALFIARLDKSNKRMLPLPLPLRSDGHGTMQRNFVKLLARKG